VNSVYRTSQDVISTLFEAKSKAFRQAVVVPFPNPTTLSLGFITREAPIACSGAVNDELVSVFVPTTPNPTSGFLLMARPKDITHIDMPVEDAVRYVISVGMILPDGGAPAPIPVGSLVGADDDKD
jgi:uncharacterized membrane protein